MGRYLHRDDAYVNFESSIVLARNGGLEVRDEEWRIIRYIPLNFEEISVKIVRKCSLIYSFFSAWKCDFVQS